MAHRRTISSRFPPDMSRVTIRPDSPPLTPIPNIAAFPTMPPPTKRRAYRYCTTFLAIAVLLLVSVYVVFLAQPALQTFHQRSEQTARRWKNEAFRLAALKHRNPNATSSAPTVRPQLTLNPSQELAAVSSFIAILPQNMIPSTVDPSMPLDPQLILDFDTRGVHAEEELQTVVNDVWNRNPVMLYSKVHSPLSREIKHILADLYLRPAPTIVEVDERPDEAVLVPLLFRLTSRTELPILLVGGRPVGEAKEIKALADSGELQKAITQAGAAINGARKKKGKKL